MKAVVLFTPIHRIAADAANIKCQIDISIQGCMQRMQCLPSQQWGVERQSREWRLPIQLPDRAWDISEQGCFGEMKVTFAYQIFAQNYYMHPNYAV